MANKTIFDLITDSNPTTGDYLASYDVSAGATKKISINRITALTPQQAESIPISGCVSGAANVGPGGGSIYYRNNNGILELKTIKAGSNITLLNNSGDVTINAADSPLIPVSSGLNVGNGTGQVFKQLNNYNLEFRTIKAGSGISIINNTGDITINFTGVASGSNGNNYTGIAYQYTLGAGLNFQIPYGGDGTSAPVYTAVTFGAGSPTLTVPAGTATYMFDWIFGVTRGSISAGLWYKLVNATTSTDITNPVPILWDRFSAGQYNLKAFASITGPATIKPYILHTGDDDSIWVFPEVVSTGTMFSYLKIN